MAALYEEVNDRPLEEAMILFANKRRHKVYRHSGWLEFKITYKCRETITIITKSSRNFGTRLCQTLTTTTLYIRNSLLIADELSYIPDPRNFPPSTPKVYEFVTDKLLWIYEREKLEEKQRRILNDPNLLRFKAHCLDFIETLIQT